MQRWGWIAATKDCGASATFDHACSRRVKQHDLPTNNTRTEFTSLFNAFAMTAYESPNAEIALDSMRKRVQSSTTEPLHSAAYLNDIVRYLSNEPPGSARHRAPSPAPKECNSVYAYEISGSHAPNTVSYSQASSLLIENANRAHLNFYASPVRHPRNGWKRL
jgi:hypothetical protein